MSEYAPGEEFNEEEAKNGEPIAADKRQAAQPLIDVFGEPVIRKIFSRTWALREKGIDEIEDDILNANKFDEAEAFVAGVGVVNQTITDKIIGVCTRSINFFINLCQRVDPNLSGNQQRDVAGYQTVILTSLVEKLGDNLAKVRQASENALLAMTSHTAFGVTPVIGQIAKGSSAPQGPKNPKKAMNSNKLIIGRYQTLARILSETANIPEDQLYVSLDYSAAGLSHALQDVRQPA